MVTTAPAVDFASWLQAELSSRDWNQTELAKRSGLTSAQVSRVLRRERPPTDFFCKKIASALGMKESDVLKAAGLLDTESEKTSDPYLDQLMRVFPYLTGAEKTHLIDVATVMLERNRSGRRG